MEARNHGMDSFRSGGENEPNETIKIFESAVRNSYIGYGSSFIRIHPANGKNG
jgi:hypothetical protein